jgi:plastocyanin domain-containing protein
MKKNRKNLHKIIVDVVCVAVIVSTCYWFTNKNGKESLALYKNTMMQELKISQNMLNEIAEKMQQSVKYADSLFKEVSKGIQRIDRH